MNQPPPFSRRQYDRLDVEIHATSTTAGQAAARQAATYLQAILETQEIARVVFACAPSQDNFLAALVDGDRCGATLDWSRIEVFHMDEYAGLPGDHPQSFRSYLRVHLLDHVKCSTVHLLEADAADLFATSRGYSKELAAAPIDLICMGIGENGHIAFNDPPVADFDDQQLVKLVELDHDCRSQQVNDGCFPSIQDVPLYALTLTIPVFRSARRLSIHVSGSRKADAVKAALTGPVDTCCPASILRTHPTARLFLEPAAASLL